VPLSFTVDGLGFRIIKVPAQKHLEENPNGYTVVATAGGAGCAATGGAAA